MSRILIDQDGFRMSGEEFRAWSGGTEYDEGYRVSGVFEGFLGWFFGVRYLSLLSWGIFLNVLVLMRSNDLLRL